MAITNDIDRHQIYLQKLASGILNSKIYPSLEEAYKAARAILLDAEEIKSIKQLRTIQEKIVKESSSIIAKGWADATDELMSAANYEAGYYADLLKSYGSAGLSVPAAARIASYVNKSTLTLANGSRVSSGTWAEFVQGGVNSSAKLYNGIVVSGYNNGLTVGQISKQIKDSTSGLLKNEANALARTGMNHYANSAREAMAEDNSDIIKYRVYTATFDNRTSLQCRANSMNPGHWAMDDDKHPAIPNHFNCRCSWVFLTDLSEINEGKKVAIGGKDVNVDPGRELRYRGKKDADIFNPGQISAGTTQNEWMRKQPDWFQDSALGPERAKLFRDGGLKIESFTDSLGKPINLDKLRELDAEAFKKAGL